MAGERYNEEFKIAAVKQVTEGGYSIADVAKRLGITTKIKDRRLRYAVRTLCRAL
jgi:transposase-like protein